MKANEPNEIYTVCRVNGQLLAILDTESEGKERVSNPSLTIDRALSLIARLEEGSFL